MRRRTSISNREHAARHRDALDTVYQLAKWPNGVSPMAFGALTASRLVACVSRGWTERTDRRDHEGSAIYQVTERGFAELFIAGITAPEVQDVA